MSPRNAIVKKKKKVVFLKYKFDKKFLEMGNSKRLKVGQVWQTNGKMLLEPAIQISYYFRLPSCFNHLKMTGNQMGT
jgi:hypothetical protein